MRLWKQTLEFLHPLKTVYQTAPAQGTVKERRVRDCRERNLMAPPRVASILPSVRRAALGRDGAGLTDGQLLRSFLNRRDEAAFEVLVHRHGPMVRGVCRRVLHNPHDADDAFQAAFVVLLRKAPLLATREIVGDWLHGVAYRTALKARAATARRRARERQAPRREAIEEEAGPEWYSLLDQEVGRLPEKYRVPVVLCDLQGHTRKEAARQLGWREGTVAGRLARARALLARRLTSRGVALSASFLAALVAREASAQVSHSLVHSTCNAARVLAAGQAAAVPVHIAALTKGVVRAMLLDKMKTVLAMFSAVLVLAVGVGDWRHAAVAGGVEGPQIAETARAAPRALPSDKPSVPRAADANRSFHFDFRVVEEKKGARKLLAAPRLVTLEGRPATFACGGERPVLMGRGRIDYVIVGTVVQFVVHSGEENKLCVDMTVSQSTPGASQDGEGTIETKSLRTIRTVEPGQPFAAILKTGEKDQATLEVAAVIKRGQTESTPNAIEEVEKDLKIAEFYRRTGYPDSASYYYERIDRDHPGTLYAERARERLAELKKRPDNPKQADKKEPARVGQIFIIGNEKTRQDVILDQVQLYPGQVLSYPDLRAAERNLARLKGFKSPPKVSVIDADSESPFKDIKITVEEK
jgi:RNA polymerase sigma factor (sigma-70 family)